ncbi:MAG: heavy metal translocating P-type ATPase [Paracoccaceae bacterium]
MANVAACPACAAAPPPAAAALRGAPDGPQRTVELSLPGIHCAACIAAVERGLSALPEVGAARVNLTLKRVRVSVTDSTDAETRLIRALDAVGYEAHPLDAQALAATANDTVGRDLLARLAVAGFAAMNVMLLSVAVWSGAEAATRDFLHWISALIALPAVAFAGMPFFRNAWSALRVRRLNMDVPISLALVLASGVSLSETFQSGAHTYFDAAVSLTFFLLIGRYLDHRTRAAARTAATELAALEVHRAERLLPDGSREVVPLGELATGDVVLAAPGARIPVDGVVESGTSEIDPSLLTGETLPQQVSAGGRVHAGMLNLSGPLRIRIDGAPEDTLVRRIAKLVEVAETARNRYTTLADAAARVYAPLVHLLAFGSLIGWGLAVGNWHHAVNVATAVLIITCPCALGLAVPAVMAAASGRLFRAGTLLKDGAALEKLAGIDTVVFDKTGTLTQGRPRLLNGAGIPPRENAVAAALAAASTHPYARAIAEAFPGAPAPRLESIAEFPGQGIEAKIAGQKVRLGRADWAGAAVGTVESSSWLRIGDEPPVAFRFADAPRPEAAETVEALHEAGLRVVMLSGDASRPAEELARAVGIGKWQAEMTPEDKVACLKRLRDDGHKVLMVGDGLNDTAALAAADVSISPASAIDASRSAADMILTAGDLRHIPAAWRLARRARARMLQNFAISAAYNVVSVPLAVSGLATPLIAALAMSASSITVSLNAMRLGGRR